MADAGHRIVYHGFQGGDFGTLSALLAELWYGTLPEPDGLLCGRAELALHLAAHTASWVADVDGVPAGVALARFGEPDPQAPRWLDRYEEARDAALSGGRLDIDAELAACAEEERLSAAWERAGGGALELLAVDPAAQGMGIGGRLFSTATDYLREAGANAFHLVTDDGCDWGFYEHKGLRRVGGGRAVVPEGSLGCYVYEGRL